MGYWKELKQPQEQLQVPPAFPKFTLCYFTSRKGLSQHLFLIIKKIFFWRDFLISYKKFQHMFYSDRHRAPQAGRLAPLSSFPGSHTSHLSVKSPQPWTLYGSTCVSLVHIHFRLQLAECALGYLLLCFMLLWLMKGFLGMLCSQTVGKPGLGTGGAICPFHPPHTLPQSDNHTISSHSVNYPVFHSCVNCPQFHKHAFMQCAAAAKSPQSFPTLCGKT